MSNNPLPSVQEINKWKRAGVITFLQSKKDELDLDDDDINIIKNNKIAGRAFLELNQEDFMQVGLLMGPAKTIAGLVREIKGGEEQGKYHDCIRIF